MISQSWMQGDLQASVLPIKINYTIYHLVLCSAIQIRWLTRVQGKCACSIAIIIENGKIEKHLVETNQLQT
jgi:hypothetical protein